MSEPHGFTQTENLGCAALYIEMMTVNTPLGLNIILLKLIKTVAKVSLNKQTNTLYVNE